MLRKLAAFTGRNTVIPFEMFDLERTADDARRDVKLKNIYHRGQDLAWDGQKVLADLLAKHGGVKLGEDKRRAIGKVFEIIFWGELAAWKISAQLADEIEPLEAKMAATSQAHDEARHFYVMHDYLKEIGYRPTRIDPLSQRVLDHTLGAPTLVHKIMGMQLMIETIALTIFQEVRESRVEPVLSDLLLYYEKDEARHVGLGTQYLPRLLARQSRREAVETLWFQVRLIFWTIASLKAMERDLHVLGIHAPTLLKHGREKQAAVFEELWAGQEKPELNQLFEKVVMGVEDALFPGLDRKLTMGERMGRFLAQVRGNGMPAPASLG
jgi:demethoxyubiquinone hydroxylase (CLK1/Coq7/Cat5 family)